MARRVAEMLKIDKGRRIGREHRQDIAIRQIAHRPPRLQHRQRTVQALGIEYRVFAHSPSGSKGRLSRGLAIVERNHVLCLGKEQPSFDQHADRRYRHGKHRESGGR